ncbi:MAG: extracellular solute-binding protein [Alphaproteobacteria bacterium]|nr:extracellular solute-binding protein [Alphaproteobacteria bacterium]
MSGKSWLFVLLFLFGPFASSSLAAQHGIAMHGQPKREAGFAHYDYVNPDAPKGGVLRLGVVGTFDSLHPFIVRGTVPTAPAFGLFSTDIVYERLMARAQDEPFTLYGLIAQTVEVPEDRSFIIFNLNPKARWQDGKALTADDVLFSFETLRDHGRPNHRTYYKKVAHAEKLGEGRVRFDFQKNADGSWDREMPLIMGLMAVLPKHIWERVNFNQTTLKPPVGSGPYKVTLAEAGRRFVLRRDLSYWGRDLPVARGLYNFDEVRIDFYRDDSIALQAFKADAFDLRREQDPKKWKTAYEGPALRDGRIILASFPHARTETTSGFVFNTRRALFSDPVLRKALSLAFDFGWINKALFQGLYKRTLSFFPNSELEATRGAAEGKERAVLKQFLGALDDERAQVLLDEDARAGLGGEDVRANLLKAAALLEKAGYVLREGRLYTPAGAAVSFEVLLSDPLGEKIALEWARALKRLGVLARVRTVDSAQYQARLNSFDFDVTTAVWANSLSPGNEQSFFWSCAAAAQQGSRNYPGICDPLVDALARAIPSARTRQDLIAHVRALDRVLLAGAYIVPFYHLGAEQIAYWTTRLERPRAVPAYGPVLESWWAR